MGKWIGNWFQESLSAENNKHRYYQVYTVIFFVVAFFVFSWFIFSDRSLIWKQDGWRQHYKALVYYAKYLRQIVRELFYQHKLVSPNWDFTIGEGGDVLQTFQYYVIGDPIAALCVFVPTRWMHWFYSLSSVLRMYLAGITFSVFAFGTGNKNRRGILAGAISYAYCYWAILCAARHPFFLNPLIYFPLIILGLEKILRKERPYLFIGAVAVASLSNFYFFYIIALVTAIYGIIRIVILHRKEFSRALRAFIKVMMSAALGAACGGVLLLPTAMTFLRDSRMTIERPKLLLYTWSYYSKLPGLLAGGGTKNWMCMGYSAPVLIALLFLLQKKKEARFQKLLLGLCLIAMIFPALGRILNGMSYETNRWSWAMAFLCAYILTSQWDELMEMSALARRRVLVLATVYLAVCMLLDRSRTTAVFSAVSLMLIVLMIVGRNGAAGARGYAGQALVCLLAVISVINVGFWHYSSEGDGSADESIANGKAFENFQNTEAQTVEAAAGGDYARYSGYGITKNAAIFSKVAATQYYWTISNPNMNRYRDEIELAEQLVFMFEGYDDRTTPLALSSVQYYISDDQNETRLPYGYTGKSAKELTEEQKQRIRRAGGKKTSIFSTEATLPLSYSYHSYITEEEWEALDPVQKQEIQLTAACLEQGAEGIEHQEHAVESYRIACSIETKDEDEIYVYDNYIVTTKNNVQAEVTFTGKPCSETYVRFAGLDFNATPEYDLFFGDETVDPDNQYTSKEWKQLDASERAKIRRDKIFWEPDQKVVLKLKTSVGQQKKLTYRNDYDRLTTGRHDYLVNMGYSNQTVDSVSIQFPQRGVYSLEDIQVFSVPMEGYEETLRELATDKLENMQIGTDEVRGTFSAGRPKLLCVSIPYSDGWTAYIDGNETPVLRSNIRHLGIAVPAGEHEITFRYRTPYKRAGAAVSLAGTAIFTGIIILTERKKRRQGQ